MFCEVLFFTRIPHSTVLFEPLTRSPLKTHSSRRANAGSSRTWLVHCGDQIGPVDIRGARPLHSGCCEAVLECATHAVDSRIFGSTNAIQENKKMKGIQVALSCKITSRFFVLRAFRECRADPPRWRQGCIAQR